jgi:malate dehydrogenase
MGAALSGADVVIVPAGVPRKPGMSRDDLFSINAGIVANIATEFSKKCPNACLVIISNPVNSTVPICATILKKNGISRQRLMGVTTLDVCRANTFVAESQHWNVNDVNVNVVGGHAGTTILPLLSQVRGATFTQEQKEALTKRIMFGGDEVVNAKAGGGSATLSMALAGAKFADLVIRGLNGEKGIKACAFVESNVGIAPFFASPIELGPKGIEQVNGIGIIDAFEQQKLNEMTKDLNDQIKKGIEFAEKFVSK